MIVFGFGLLRTLAFCRQTLMTDEGLLCVLCVLVVQVAISITAKTQHESKKQRLKWAEGKIFSHVIWLCVDKMNLLKEACTYLVV